MTPFCATSAYFLFLRQTHPAATVLEQQPPPPPPSAWRPRRLLQRRYHSSRQRTLAILYQLPKTSDFREITSSPTAHPPLYHLPLFLQSQKQVSMLSRWRRTQLAPSRGMASRRIWISNMSHLNRQQGSCVSVTSAWQMKE